MIRHGVQSKKKKTVQRHAHQRSRAGCRRGAQTAPHSLPFRAGGPAGGAPRGTPAVRHPWDSSSRSGTAAPTKWRERGPHGRGWRCKRVLPVAPARRRMDTPAAVGVPPAPRRRLPPPPNRGTPGWVPSPPPVSPHRLYGSPRRLYLPPGSLDQRIPHGFQKMTEQRVMGWDGGGKGAQR